MRTISKLLVVLVLLFCLAPTPRVGARPNDWLGLIPVPRPPVHHDYWVGRRATELAAARGKPTEVVKASPRDGLRRWRYVIRPFPKFNPGLEVEYGIDSTGRIVSADTMMVVKFAHQGRPPYYAK